MAYRNSWPCQAATGAAWVSSSTSAKRTDRSAESHFNSDRSLYSRAAASATPRLTGCGTFRP